MMISNIDIIKFSQKLFKFNDPAERFRIEARASHQRSVNIRHLHDLSDIVRFDAAPVQDPNGVRESSTEIRFN